ncbi:MAG: EVE domain-containing protein [Gemmatimonadales bacterium]|nr:MAG: EVE domain-containing protein [Gemmatimonadales bacterium]
MADSSKPKRFWLVKSEEDVYSIDHLEKDGTTPWDGIRNYEARNTMRDLMKEGDLVLYYHSNASPPGVAGLARVASTPYPDPFQFDSESPYFDPKATREEPRWFLVDMAFVEKFPRLVALAEIREHPDLEDMTLLRRMRLSVQPVDPAHFEAVCAMGRGRGGGAERA